MRHTLGFGLGWQGSAAIGRNTVFENVFILHHQVTETPLGPRNDEENEWTLVGET